MSKTGSLASRWLPVAVWMALIFSASGDTHSYQHSSSILAPLVKFFFPRISPAALEEAVVFFRKCAHLAEYAVLALLLWRAIRKPVRRRWSWREARLAVLLVAMYAASDEFHQTFVPGRDGCVRDVAIDTCGGVMGIGALWLYGRWRKPRPVAFAKKGEPLPARL